MSGIKYNSGVTNYKETPYAISDSYDNLGEYLPNIKGALYFAIDGTTQTILQADGNNWIPLAGNGSAGFGTLQQVTNLGASTDNTLTLLGYGIYSDPNNSIFSLGTNRPNDDGTGLLINLNISNYIQLGDYSDLGGGVVLNIGSSYLYIGSNGNVPNGIELDFFYQYYSFGDLNTGLATITADGVNGLLYLNGDTSVGISANGIQNVLIISNNIVTEINGLSVGFKVDSFSQNTTIGDYNFDINNTRLDVNVSTGEISTAGSSGLFGFFIDTFNFVSQFGDINNSNNGTIISIEDNSAWIIFTGQNYIFNNIQTFATNALAIAGGVPNGGIYKNAVGVLSIVY